MIPRIACAASTLLLGLALAGCAEPAEQPDNKPTDQPQDLDAPQVAAASAAPADVREDRPDVLGSLYFTAGDQRFEQQVIECRLRATPETSQGMPARLVWHY